MYKFVIFLGVAALAVLLAVFGVNKSEINNGLPATNIAYYDMSEAEQAVYMEKLVTAFNVEPMPAGTRIARPIYKGDVGSDIVSVTHIHDKVISASDLEKPKT